MRAPPVRRIDTAGAGPAPLVLPPDLRFRGDDRPLGIDHHEVAVGDAGGERVRADEDVDPVAVVPEPPDLHLPEVFRLAELPDHLPADEGANVVALPRLGVLRARFALSLLRHRHSLLRFAGA